MIPNKHSFRLVSKKEIKKIKLLKKLRKQKAVSAEIIENQKKLAELEVEKDSNKRAFLKLAGLVGIGAVASALIPKKAEALVFGSTPAASHVGVKNSTNSPIDPATEGTLQSLNTNATAINTATAAIKVNSDKFHFDENNNLLIGSTPAGAANIGNSVNDQSIWMLRKIITLLKPLGMTTGAGSNRLSVDVVNAGTVAISSGTVTTVTTVSTLTNLGNVGNVNAFSLMKDTARNAYANSIRSKISF